MCEQDGAGLPHLVLIYIFGGFFCQPLKHDNKFTCIAVRVQGSDEVDFLFFFFSITVVLHPRTVGGAKEHRTANHPAYLSHCLYIYTGQQGSLPDTWSPP